MVLLSVRIDEAMPGVIDTDPRRSSRLYVVLVRPATFIFLVSGGPGAVDSRG